MRNSDRRAIRADCGTVTRRRDEVGNGGSAGDGENSEAEAAGPREHQYPIELIGKQVQQRRCTHEHEASGEDPAGTEPAEQPRDERLRQNCGEQQDPVDKPRTGFVRTAMHRPQR